MYLAVGVRAHRCQQAVCQGAPSCLASFFYGIRFRGTVLSDVDGKNNENVFLHVSALAGDCTAGSRFFTIEINDRNMHNGMR